ncbi:MAG TPA: hypothetical protein VGC88_04195 [Terriglobales bacterium]
MARSFVAQFTESHSRQHLVRLRSDDGQDQIFEATLDDDGLRRLCDAVGLEYDQVTDPAEDDAITGVIADIEIDDDKLGALGFTDVSERFQLYRVEVCPDAKDLQRRLVEAAEDGYVPEFLTQSGASYTLVSSIAHEHEHGDEFDDEEDFDEEDEE